ncbi:hypothetical protein [Phytomonospora endophytica]|uniref:WD40 repeat domain-containing protein n=1 Tax=Phytomonospora endophytica TaxID=714109 RepID=A0A841FYM7_9ACTN|nr:hypothetical protein [Phytomonospora endophytica]MBB6037539.1 hypothetical protein [Phytomonospora endophytica]GIG70240.1 hypothetical protein Pen01_65350 [Phytomonospora endophytica]
MSDETISEGLKSVPMPADLVPPHGFADSVLRRRARARGTRAVVAVVAVVAVLAGASAAIGGADRSAPPADPYPSSSADTLPDDAVPRPGGGPRVIEAFSNGWMPYLLDQRSGEYLAVPFRAEVSPDGGQVAVSDLDRGLGVAGREAYLDGGESAVAWVTGPEVTDTVGGVRSLWSPDGSKVFGATEVDAGLGDGSGRLGTLTSYDAVTGQLVVTTVPADWKVTGVVWAPDSAGYAVAVEREDGRTEVRHLTLAGVVGATVELDGSDVILVGYSPDGGRLLYENGSWNEEEGTGERQAVVADAATGRTELTAGFENGNGHGASTVGWLDDGALLMAVDPSPEEHGFVVVDAETGDFGPSIPWPTAENVSVWSVGSSAGLPPEAADLGF